MSLKGVDLFAGCGGLSQGFSNAGVDLLAAFENWETAAKCYEDNFNHPVYREDLNNVDKVVGMIEELKPQIIIGGPPCQDFSHAGKRIEAGRASLTEAYANIVTKVRPQYFLMENVDRAQKSNAYGVAREIFKNAGYGLTERVLLASRCGVPQRRKRFFCIGVLGGEDGALADILDSGLSEKEMTVRDYLGDSLDTDFYYRHPRNYNRRGVFSIDEPAPTMRGVNRPIPKGYPGHPKDACKVSDGVRPLTTLERSLIQTFPANFKWSGSKTDQEQMIGNAVPVNLGTYVAKAIIQFDKERKSIDLDLSNDAFTEWLEKEKKLSNRSASDAKSRLGRANDILKLEDPSDPEFYLVALEKTKGFEALSKTVKSQLRRAVRLYAEYVSDHGGQYASR